MRCEYVLIFFNYFTPCNKGTIKDTAFISMHLYGTMVIHKVEGTFMHNSHSFDTCFAMHISKQVKYKHSEKGLMLVLEFHSYSLVVDTCILNLLSKLEQKPSNSTL